MALHPRQFASRITVLSCNPGVGASSRMAEALMCNDTIAHTANRKLSIRNAEARLESHPLWTSQTDYPLYHFAEGLCRCMRLPSSEPCLSPQLWMTTRANALETRNVGGMRCARALVDGFA